MGKVKDGNYITILSWMVTELKLKGNELIIYAAIYGFSQDEQWFAGSLQYLADWTNSTRQGVLKALKSLVSKGYLEKEEREIKGVKLCQYRTKGVKQSLTGCSTKFNEGVKQSLTNINNDIYSDNDKYIYGEKEEKPTLEQVKAYCQERKSNVDPGYFWDYYQGTGWKLGGSPIGDWKAVLRNWERRSSAQSSQKEGRESSIDFAAIQQYITSGGQNQFPEPQSTDRIDPEW